LLVYYLFKVHTVELDDLQKKEKDERKMVVVVVAVGGGGDGVFTFLVLVPFPLITFVDILHEHDLAIYVVQQFDVF